MKKFWMVWNSQRSHNMPSVQHHTLAAARAEADRLSKTTPGITFIVLEAIYELQGTVVVDQKVIS